MTRKLKLYPALSYFPFNGKWKINQSKEYMNKYRPSKSSISITMQMLWYPRQTSYKMNHQQKRNQASIWLHFIYPSLYLLTLKNLLQNGVACTNYADSVGTCTLITDCKWCPPHTMCLLYVSFGDWRVSCFYTKVTLGHTNQCNTYLGKLM